QARHVPAGRVRRLSESLADPQLKARGVLHEHAKIDGVEGPVTVPLAAFKFAHGGPSIQTPPPRLGQPTDDVLASLGYSKAEIATRRAGGVIGAIARSADRPRQSDWKETRAVRRPPAAPGL